MYEHRVLKETWGDQPRLASVLKRVSRAALCVPGPIPRGAFTDGIYGQTEASVWFATR
jgi:hypothetical protein